MRSQDPTADPRAHLRLASPEDHAPLWAPGLHIDPAPAPSALELLDAETRILARAVGAHLPLELALQVDELRARRAALRAGA